MKNGILILLLSLVSSLKIFSQNITFKDPNFKYALTNLKVVDVNLDGNYDVDADTNDDKEISIQEAEAVLSLQMGSSLIKEIPEIYLFKNLRHLDARTGKIVDFPELDKLTLLESFKFTVITEKDIEIKSHPALRRCTLQFKSPVKKVSITQNIHLTYLNLGTSQFGDMPPIDTVEVNNNALDTLITRPIVPSINEGYFNCSNNQLTDANSFSYFAFNTSILSNNKINTNTIYFEGKNLDLKKNQFDSLTLILTNNIKELTILDNPLRHFIFDALKNIPSSPPFQIALPNLTSFSNLESVQVKLNPLHKFTSADIRDLNILKSLDLSANCDTSIFIQNLPAIENLKLYTKAAIIIENINPIALQKNGPFTEIYIENKLTLKNCLAGMISFKYFESTHYEIINNPQLTALRFNMLSLTNTQITVQDNPHLRKIDNTGGHAGNIDSVALGNLPDLDTINLGANNLLNFTFEGIPNITYFKLTGKHPLFVFDGYLKLKDIYLHPDGVYLLNLPKLKTVDFTASSRTNFKLENLPELQFFRYHGTLSDSQGAYLHCDFIFRNLPKLQSIIIGSSSYLNDFNFNNLIISNLPELDTVFITPNFLRSYCKNIYINNLQKLKTLRLSGFSTENVEISDCHQLDQLSVAMNGKPRGNSLRISENPNLSRLFLSVKYFNEVVISNHEKLKTIKMGNYDIRTLKFNNLPVLERIYEDFDTQVSSKCNVSFTKLPKLRYFSSLNRYFDTLDFSECPIIDSIYFHIWPSNHDISFLNLKNGNPNFSYLNWDFNFPSSNNIIKTICSDSQTEEDNLKKYILNSSKSTFTQDCSFSYTYAYYDGRVTSQYNNTNYPIANTTYFPVDIMDDQVLTRVFTDGGGIYRYLTDSKDKHVSILPANFNPNFEYLGQPIIFDPNQYGVFVDQDFTLSINNPIPDIEAIIHSQQAAVPGTELKLKLEIKNTSPFDAACAFQLSFDHEYMKIKNSGGLQNNVDGILSGESGNISPYSSVIIPISFILNKPTDTPPLNLNDQLTFHLITFPQQADLKEENNIFSAKLKVVNSFDPNNIICAQGDEVASNEEIQKIFYTINFENLGNAAAKNIRIENTIDTNWLDVNSFELVNYSHPAQVSITGDLATYHFEDIELPASGENIGYNTYAIRPKKELVKGDTIPNKADIYFDFNFPIATNRHTLTLVEPSGTYETDESSVTIFPNPASTGIFINATNISRVTISDLIGNVEYNTQQPDSYLSFDLPNGGYVVNIALSNGLMVKRKLVVVR